MTEPKLNFILTNRLAKQLEINNYLFYKNNEREGKTYWQCKESRLISGQVNKDGKCKSTCVTIGLDEACKLVAGPSEHNHEPYRNEKINMIEFKSLVKKRASLEKTPIPQIYAQEFAKICAEKKINFNEENLDEVPKLKSIKEYLYKARKRKLDQTEVITIEDDKSQHELPENTPIDITIQMQPNVVESITPSLDIEPVKPKEKVIVHQTIVKKSPNFENEEILRLTKENCDLRSKLEIQLLKQENEQLRSSLEIQKLKHEKEMLDQKIQMQTIEISLLREKK